MKRGIAAASLLVILMGSALAQDAHNAVEYELVIDCPDTRNGECPIQAWDLDDAMGDPAIAVDPDDIDNMIIASLHGAEMRTDGPTPKSRPGQSYTTFTTTNHGASWRDSPYTPPREIPGDAFGEHPSIALDPYGHVFVGSLYSIPASNRDAGPSGVYDYVLAAQKFDDLQDIQSNQDGDYNTQYMASIYPGNAIKQTWFLHNPITDNMTAVWTEQLTPNSYAAGGESRISSDLTQVLSQAPASLVSKMQGPLNGGLGPQPDAPMSVIAVRWTDVYKDSPYHAQPLEWTIGPCATSTNPVLSEGWMYIGCKVSDEAPLRWDAAAKPGDIAMFRMHPDGGEPQYLGLAPVEGGAPKLGVRSDGRMAIMTTEVFEGDKSPRIRLDGSYGQYDPETGRVAWGDVYHYGNRLQIIYANAPYVHVNIQDMIYREYSGVIHLILKRVVEWPDTDVGYRPSFFKSIVAIDEVHGLLKEMDLGIGALTHRMKDSGLFLMDEQRFNDTSDDFLELPAGPYRYQGRALGDTYQRQFYAVGNYGIIDFAEVIEITELRGPAFPALPNPPPPPTPAPAASTSLALGMAGALTASSIVAGTAATLKKKSVTGAGRKKRM